MFKIIGLITFLLFPPHSFSKELLPKLLQLRPGMQLPKDLKSSGKGNTYDYEIDLKKNQVSSIRIDFSVPQLAKTIIPETTRGFCFNQAQTGSVMLIRPYFFTEDKTQRYELTLKKEIKSITIQNFPDLNQNESCIFKNFDPKKAYSPSLEKGES